MSRSQLPIIAWLGMMLFVLLLPALMYSDRLEDIQIRGTVDVALLYYALAAAAMLTRSRQTWEELRRPVAEIRLTWSLAWAAFAVHVVLAFHHEHHWSHSHAVRHTRDVSGVGEGIYVSHLFALLWGSDVGWWWARPLSYVRRPRWLGAALHGFMAFVIFCGSVVYESGPIRWAATAGFLLLGILLVRRLLIGMSERRARRDGPAPQLW